MVTASTGIFLRVQVKISFQTGYARQHHESKRHKNRNASRFCVTAKLTKGGKESKMKRKIYESPGKKYGNFLHEVRETVTDAAVSDAEGYQFLIDHITEIMEAGFVLLKNRLSKK